MVQKPKLYIGDYVRIAKTDLPFRKGYQQIFLSDKIFEIVAFPTVNPPINSRFDAGKEEINWKTFEKELSLIGNKADFDKDGQWWVHCTLDINSINRIIPRKHSGQF